MVKFDQSDTRNRIICPILLRNLAMALPGSPAVTARWQNAMPRSPRDQEGGHAHGQHAGTSCGDMQLEIIHVLVQSGALDPEVPCAVVRRGECFLLNELPATQRKVVYTLDRPVVPLCTIL